MHQGAKSDAIKSLFYEKKKSTSMIQSFLDCGEFAFFPSTVDHQVVLPFPDKGKTFAYTDKDIPILGRFVGNAVQNFVRIISVPIH